MKNLIIAIVLMLALFLTGIYIGAEIMKNEYLIRASHLEEKDCFDNQDIEHILFNNALENEQF